jgi:hypothetical protein
VGVYLMFFAGERIKKWNVRFKGLKFGSSKGEACGVNNFRTSFAIVAGIGVLALAVFLLRFLLPPPEYGTASFVAGALPARVWEFRGEIPWFCQDPQCLEMAEESALKRGTVDRVEGYLCPVCGKLMHSVSLGEATKLPRDTVILKRNYRAVDGLGYAVSVVIQGKNRNSIHRAELCLPAQGFIMEKAQRMPLKIGGQAEPLTVRKINAHRPDGGHGISLVYWFESRERKSCSHTERILTDVWDRSIHNRINRWVMVAVNVSSGVDSPESVERFEAFLSELYPEIFLGR